MSSPIILNKAQIKALDEIIAALQSGELSQEEFRSTFFPALAAPTAGAGRGGAQDRLVTALTTAHFGLATILLTAVLAPMKSEIPLPGLKAKIPPGLALKQLLKLRRLATARKDVSKPRSSKKR